MEQPNMGMYTIERDVRSMCSLSKNLKEQTFLPFPSKWPKISVSKETEKETLVEKHFHQNIEVFQHLIQIFSN